MNEITLKLIYAKSEFLVLALNSISTRTRWLAKTLESPLIVIKSKPPYINMIPKIIKKIKEYNPNKIIIQLPTGPLLLATVIIKSLSRDFKLIADTHTGFFSKLTLTKHGLLNAPFKSLLKYVDLILIHNELNYSLVENIKGKTIVLYDPFYALNTNINKLEYCEVQNIGLSDYSYAVYPASWHPDEPIEWLVNRWIHTNTNTTLIITGRPNINRFRTLKSIFKKYTKKIKITGYLDYDAYLCLLYKSKYIVSATTSQLDMQCSAYEALALNKPILASNTAALKKVLKYAAVYFNYNQNSLNQSIDNIEENHKSYIKKIEMRKKELKQLIEQSLKILYTI